MNMELNDILELEGVKEYKESQWDHYSYNNSGVPRVTHILSQCRDSQYLINWAANIGYRKYQYYTEKALEIGSLSHELIDEYIMTKYNKTSVTDLTYENIEPEYRASVYNCVENFKLWEENLNKLGYFIDKVIGVEIPISCPWFGGTIDAILVINGATYIIDFKTSKKISSEYLVQVAAYMWLINNGFASNLPHIDGVGIIRIDKAKYGKFEDLFLNSFVPEQNNMILNYQNCFTAYLSAYYRTVNINYITDNYKNTYDQSNVFNKLEEAS